MKKSIVKVYSLVAALLLNTLILIIIINVIAFGVLMVWQIRENQKNIKQKALLNNGVYFNADGSPIDNGKRSVYMMTMIDYKSYGDLNQKAVSDILDDFYGLTERGSEYQPWVQFSEPLYSSKSVNIQADSFGFYVRKTSNPQIETSRIVRKVFTLGGSTTLGYHVGDADTYPSFLSEMLNKKAASLGIDTKIEVVNFGRGYYNPSQETILLIDLLKSGRAPAIVIFLDGVNWGKDADVPDYTFNVKKRFELIQFGKNLEILSLASRIPVIEVINKLRNYNPFMTYGPAEDEDSLFKNNPTGGIEMTVNRFRQSKDIAKKVCELYQVQCLFILQPDAYYNYPYENYRTIPTYLGIDKKLDRQYRVIFYNKIREDKDYIDLTNLFSEFGKNKKVIVDNVHYNPQFNKFLAGAIAELIDINSVRNKQSDYSGGATGVKRN